MFTANVFNLQAVHFECKMIIFTSELLPGFMRVSAFFQVNLYTTMLSFNCCAALKVQSPLTSGAI